MNGIEADSPENTTLILTWQPPSTPNGVIQSYSVVIIDLSNGIIKRNESVHGRESRFVVNVLGIVMNA